VRLSLGDRIAITLMVVIPMLVVGTFIWFPTFSSIYLSLTNWDGIGGVSTIHILNPWYQNYDQIAHIYPPFYPAIEHNVYWLLFLFLLATPFGLFLAYALDKELRFGAFYQSIFFLPVVLSLAVIGFIWEIIYSPTQGLISNLFADPKHGHVIDLLGNSSQPHGFLGHILPLPINLMAVLVAVGWRHAGYIMILYLAGLKSVDPSLREAAAIDGASEWHAFRTVVFPALKPINIVVIVITVIEALRAFDIVYIVNQGRNGLELLSVLVTQNIIGEASRIGYGSALGTILLLISLVPIIIFVWNNFRERQL
jgi:ABC-type sugar transport system permease subunit